MMALQRKIKQLTVSMNANNRKMAVDQAYLHRIFKPTPAITALMMFGGFAVGYLFARKKRLPQLIGASLALYAKADTIKRGFRYLPYLPFYKS